LLDVLNHKAVCDSKEIMLAYRGFYYHNVLVCLQHNYRPGLLHVNMDIILLDHMKKFEFKMCTQNLFDLTKIKNIFKKVFAKGNILQKSTVK